MLRLGLGLVLTRPRAAVEPAVGVEFVDDVATSVAYDPETGINTVTKTGGTSAYDGRAISVSQIGIGQRARLRMLTDGATSYLWFGGSGMTDVGGAEWRIAIDNTLLYSESFAKGGPWTDAHNQSDSTVPRLWITPVADGWEVHAGTDDVFPGGAPLHKFTDSAIDGNPMWVKAALFEVGAACEVAVLPV